ncbi:pirin family protein [Vreelandella rituensis]|uniref:Pirin family protein n=1 Tax=Vreelandella rituensis TaxID=2282306 RepID=A0A368U8U3_9GAMM|nr:pirin family protein [Halomonas rituensis]RCV92916.1 pirin family protein [Halomonas rituensis]
MASSTLRVIDHLVQARPSQDGDGVKIKRISAFGGALDPFLMLDELGSDELNDYIGGFPAHPHRGIQTLTYVIHGGLTHEDHLGHTSTILAGDAQWMHTGRGMIHSEMPLTDHQGLRAFQLWLNLPAKDKLSPATYRDVRSEEMPRLAVDNGTLIALGGTWQTTQGALIQGPLDALAGNGSIAHLALSPQGNVTLATPTATLLVYVFEGKLECGDKRVRAGELARFAPGNELFLTTSGGAQALLLSGEPHHEPIAHYGPFVMNEQHELKQALQDYRNGSFGASL